MLGRDCKRASAARLPGVMLGLLWLAIGASAAAAEAPAASGVTHLVGTVLDASGKPAAGAVIGIVANLDVYVEPARLTKAGRTRRLGVRTDAAGRFDLVIPRSFGAVTVVARRAGSLSAKSASIALTAARQDVPALQLREGLKFTGRVLDEQRRPIPAVIVQAVAEVSRSDTTGGVSQTVRGQTRRDGSFELTGLDMGAVTLVARSRSHALWTRQGHQLDASAGSRRLEIVLKKGMYLAGRVLDVQGQPIAGVTLTTSQPNSLTTATSDASGRFRLGPFEAGQAQGIDARLTGHTPFREFFTAPRSDLVVMLNRNAALRGRVLDASNNQPVPRFQVIVHNPKGDRGELRNQRKRTQTIDSRAGRFELSNLYTGPWTITVVARGYQTWERVDFEFQNGVAHDLAVSLSKGLMLRGRVIDKASGKPLPGAEVSYEARPRYMYDPVVATGARSDAAGTFILEGIPSGTVAIRARARGYLDTVERVSADSQTFVELAALRGTVIRGQVFATDGVTPARAMVMLYSGSSGRSGYGRATDEQGRFEFSREAAGLYRLQATTDSARSETQEVTLIDGQDLTDLSLRLAPGAAVRGRVSGVPAAELATAKVYATDGGAERFDRMFTLPPSRSSVAIDAGGQYWIQGLGGGPAMVTARARFSSIVRQVEVPERGEATLDFDFGDVQVSGRVTRDGRPAPGTRVFARPLEGQLVFALATATATGEYTLCNLARGRYSVGAYNGRAVEIQVGRGVVQNFELGAELVISGRAVDAATGQGLAEVAPQLVALTPGGGSIDLFGMLKSNRQGDFKLSQLKPGDYRLILYRAGYDIAEQRVMVSTSVTDLVIELRPAEGALLRVRTADEEPISGVGVYEAGGEPEGLHLSVQLDQYGVARLPPSLAGRALRIQHGGYVPHSVERWNGGPLDIELRPSR